MSTGKDTKPLDVAVVAWAQLEDRKPFAAHVDGVDLVVVRFDDRHSVLSGRCRHRGALMADAMVRGDNLVCGLHYWDFRIDTGVSTYNPAEHLHRFRSDVVDGFVMISAAELAEHRTRHGLAPDGTQRSEYDVYYASSDPPDEEPFVGDIQRLALRGLDRVGPHGALAAMGVPRDTLPSWDGLQFVTAQLARRPLLDDEPVGTDVVVGPGAEQPLRLEIPILVSDMSFGALSAEAKIALARGAERAGTGVCSGEGGMLPEEQAESSRYFYELGSGRFGWSPSLLKAVQAFHLKFGQGAKTGTGGHLPGLKVKGRIAEVRGLPEGTAAVSPANFPDLRSVADVRDFLAGLRAVASGIPFGVKLSAQHIEEDIDAALEIGVDYIILDGRGGGTGAAPKIIRDHISVPTIPALARARRHLDARGRADVTLIATGGLRTAPDFAKALALGADAVAVANSALQAIGCVGMRACNTDKCPVGIATQDERLRSRLPVDTAADRLARFLTATTQLIAVLARACGHSHVSQFCPDDLVTFDRDLHHLSGVAYAGVLGGTTRAG